MCCYMKAFQRSIIIYCNVVVESRKSTCHSNGVGTDGNGGSELNQTEPVVWGVGISSLGTHTLQQLRDR